MLTIGILAAELDVEVDQLVAGDGLAGALLEGVGAVAVVELGRGDVEREEDLLARLVAGVLDGLQDGFERGLGALELRREAAFVADGGAEALLLQHGLERVEGLGDGAQAFARRCRSPCGMIMNSWKSIGASECAPPLMTLAIGTGSTLAFGPPRYLNSGRPSASAAALALASETARMALAPSLDLVSVPSSLSMVRSTVSWSSASRPRSAGQDLLRDVLDGLGDAFAEVALLVAVAQFEGFVFAGAGARGHRRAAHRAAGQDHVNFHRGVTARIEDFTRLYVMDCAHKYVVFNSELRKSGKDSQSAPLTLDSLPFVSS